MNNIYKPLPIYPLSSPSIVNGGRNYALIRFMLAGIRSFTQIRHCAIDFTVECNFIGSRVSETLCNQGRQKCDHGVPRSGGIGNAVVHLLSRLVSLVATICTYIVHYTLQFKYFRVVQTYTRNLGAS